MTTTVTVKTHDWEVLVTAKDTTTKKNISKARVPKNTSQDFYVFNGQDLFIKEIQPKRS